MSHAAATRTSHPQRPTRRPGGASSPTRTNTTGSTRPAWCRPWQALPRGPSSVFRMRMSWTDGDSSRTTSPTTTSPGMSRNGSSRGPRPSRVSLPSVGHGPTNSRTPPLGPRPPHLRPVPHPPNRTCSDSAYRSLTTPGSHAPCTTGTGLRYILNCRSARRRRRTLLPRSGQQELGRDDQVKDALACRRDDDARDLRC